MKMPMMMRSSLLMVSISLLAAVTLLLLLPESCQAYSLYSNNNNKNIADFAAKTLSQKSIVRDTLFNAAGSTTTRSRNSINENTIRMMPAGQTPMVPYKVRVCRHVRVYVVQ
jgi:hypothetical protein